MLSMKPFRQVGQLAVPLICLAIIAVGAFACRSKDPGETGSKSVDADQRTNTIKEWRSFVLYEENFQFWVPADWEFKVEPATDERSGKKRGLLVFCKPGSKSKFAKERIDTVVGGFNDPSIQSVEDAIKQDLAMTRRRLPDAKLIASTKKFVNSTAVLSFTMQLTNEADPRLAIGMYLHEHGRTYICVYRGPRSFLLENRSWLGEITKSFDLVKKP